MSIMIKPANQASNKGTRLVAEANLPSRFGMFRVIAFEADDGKDYIAVVKGEVAGQQAVPVRIHSECFTGDVLGSLRCDCREQLEASLAHIGAADCGVVLYLRQEGRGIGLVNKVKAYALQDAGLDTVEANEALGFADDLRSYEVAASMLHDLHVESIQILTNNPAKVSGLKDHGVQVVGVLPLRVGRNPHNAYYLDTKKIKSGHLL